VEYRVLRGRVSTDSVGRMQAKLRAMISNYGLTIRFTKAASAS
jgi:hypothetical protein